MTSGESDEFVTRFSQYGALEISKPIPETVFKVASKKHYREHIAHIKNLPDPITAQYGSSPERTNTSKTSFS